MSITVIKKRKNLKDMSPVRLIVSSFLIIIILGTMFLYLPFSSRNMEPIKLIDAFFTATSATCVTGLNVFDTFSRWTFFGQAVIILLIQFGGLGIITFTTGFTLAFRRKLGLRDLQIAKEYTNGSVIDTQRLMITILIWSLVCEGIGALLLSIRFVPKYGLFGLWISTFTAISAYCNAGFDIMGFIEPGASFISYASDPLVSITISILVIFGGIGFIVISDVYSVFLKKNKNKNVHPRLTLHSRLAIYMSVVLLVLGTFLFFIFEYNNTLYGMNFFEKLNVSFFQSSVARTAGFFTVPLASEKGVTKMLTIILMFIGASPSSTGGGIKTTTFIVILATVLGVLKGDEDATLLKHRVEKFNVYKSITITALALLIISVVTTVMSVMESSKGIEILDIIFEAVSAFATVGLTTGITPMLSFLSKILIIITMFIGRVGPISLILALTLRKERGVNKVLPSSKIVVG